MAGLELWHDDEFSGDYGVVLPADTPKREVALTFLTELNGGVEADYTDAEIQQVIDGLYFAPLFSVLAWQKREDLPDDCDWHTDGQGKRSKPTWWLRDDALAFIDVHPPQEAI